MSYQSGLKSAILSSDKETMSKLLENMGLYNVYKCLEMRMNESLRRENGEVEQEQTSQAESIDSAMVKKVVTWSMKTFYLLDKDLHLECNKRLENLNMRKQKMEAMDKKHEEELSSMVKNQEILRKHKMEDLVKKHEEELSLMTKNQETLRNHKMVEDLTKKHEEEMSLLVKNQETLRKQNIEDLVENHKEESFWLEKNQMREITSLEETLAREDYDEQRSIAGLEELRDEVIQELKKLAINVDSSKLEFIKRMENLSMKMETAVSAERSQTSIERKPEIEAFIKSEEERGASFNKVESIGEEGVNNREAFIKSEETGALFNKVESIRDEGVTNHEDKEVKKDYNQNGAHQINHATKYRVKTKPNCALASCPNKGRHRCSRCKAVFYCHENCLSQDWPHHKIFCDYVYRANKVHDDSTCKNPSKTENTSGREEVD